jgi:hypothetical protein
MDKSSNTEQRAAQTLVGNITLRQALAFMGIARSTAYHYGIVAEYNERGKRKPPRRTPPFPWLPMPDSITRSGSCRKLFRAEDILAWRDAMHARSSQMADCNRAVETGKNGLRCSREEDSSHVD